MPDIIGVLILPDMIHGFTLLERICALILPDVIRGFTLQRTMGGGGGDPA